MGVKNAFLGRLLASSDKFSEEQVAQTISLLIEHAVAHNASDIHIEPQDRFVQVRYRIDNILRSMHKLPLTALPAVISYLKDAGGLKIAHDHMPQEGQYSTLVGEEQFEIQVFTMPVIGGQKAVLHVSRRLDNPPTLESLGFWGDNLTDIHRVLTATHGLIVVATPRRNGKTTTLHSLLQLVNTPAVSVATVEDSLEFRVRGASQTIAGAKHGVSIGDGLRAALHQDPNIIMLSTLPDRQTANVAIQAAAGGHLILTGVHGDDTIQTALQLQTMAEENFLYATALKAIISQRLARRLCPACSEQYTPSREEIQSIEKTFGITSASARQRVHQLEQQAIHEGMGERITSTTPTGIAGLWRAREEGCNACNHSGYRGVIAVTEVLTVAGTEIANTLLASASADKLRRVALKDGFVPMELDGFIKALRGQTTVGELLRLFS